MRWRAARSPAARSCHSEPIRLAQGRLRRRIRLLPIVLTGRTLTMLPALGTPLIGPGGTGKSTLAVALATELASDFAGGAWFVDLTPIHDPRLVSAAIAQTLGVRETGSAALADSLFQRLGEQPTLLVLDNFAHV